jgi:uncharacterized membrane protein
MLTTPSEPLHSTGPPQDAGLSSVVHRNIRALTEVRKKEERQKTPSDRIADAVTRFAGSMWSVYFHATLFGAWIVINLGWIAGVKRFDPSFVVLAMFASVEAIFLSTFILISQNRMQQVAERRAELDLQISLLTEHELTRAIHSLDDIAHRLGAYRPPEPELADIKRDVEPERVIEVIEKVEQHMDEAR